MRSLSVALALATWWASAVSQQPMPFFGSGDSPPSVNTEVHVSAYLDRLLSVNDQLYEWEAVLFIYVSWRDNRTAGIIADTIEEIKAGNYSCVQPCQSNMKVLSGGCCDKIWTPHIDMVNIKFLPQDRVVRFGVGWYPDHDGVFTWRSLHAVFYTPMNFRAFPFDSQNLLVQMEVPNARSGWAGGLLTLYPSVTGTRLYSAKTGDDVSGWAVREVHLLPYRYDFCSPFNAYAGGFSNDADPVPLRPAYMARTKPSNCSAFILSEPDGAPVNQSAFRRDPSFGDLPGLVQVSGLAINVHVSRFYSQWIIGAVLPIVATTWMTFLVFILPRDQLESRLGAIVALFLAIAAIQFVVNGSMPQSSYTTPLQMLILASYCALVMTAMSVLLVYYVAKFHENKKRTGQHKVAKRTFMSRLSLRRRSWRRAHAASNSKDGSSSAAPPAGSMRRNPTFKIGDSGPARGKSGMSRVTSTSPFMFGHNGRDGAKRTSSALRSSSQDTVSPSGSRNDFEAPAIRLSTEATTAAGGTVGGTLDNGDGGGPAKLHSVVVAVMDHEDGTRLPNGAAPDALSVDIPQSGTPHATATTAAGHPPFLPRLSPISSQRRESPHLEASPVAVASADGGGGGDADEKAAVPHMADEREAINSPAAAPNGRSSRSPQGGNAALGQAEPLTTQDSRLSEGKGTSIGAGASGKDKPPVKWWLRAWVLVEMLGDDPDFCDRVSYQVNLYCAVGFFLAYDLTAVLVFVLNPQAPWNEKAFGTFY